MDVTDQSPEHLTAQELAGFLERELSTDEHRRVAAHLNGCAECRSEMSRASAVLGRNRSRRRLVAGLVPLAAAAAIAAVLLVPDSALGPRGDPPVVRGGGEGTVVFEAASPADGEVVDLAQLSFVWRSAGTDARYELTITDERGDPVWSGGSMDTVLAPPPDVPLAAGETYFWNVDALLDGARSATTVFRRFTIEP